MIKSFHQIQQNMENTMTKQVEQWLDNSKVQYEWHERSNQWVVRTELYKLHDCLTALFSSSDVPTTRMIDKLLGLTTRLPTETKLKGRERDVIMSFSTTDNGNVCHFTLQTVPAVALVLRQSEEATNHPTLTPCETEFVNALSTGVGCSTRFHLSQVEIGVMSYHITNLKYVFSFDFEKQEVKEIQNDFDDWVAISSAMWEVIQTHSKNLPKAIKHLGCKPHEFLKEVLEKYIVNHATMSSYEIRLMIDDLVSYNKNILHTNFDSKTQYESFIDSPEMTYSVKLKKGKRVADAPTLIVTTAKAQ